MSEANELDLPNGWACLNWDGLGRLGMTLFSLPRIRCWVGLVALELLFDQVDKSGLIVTTWC